MTEDKLPPELEGDLARLNFYLAEGGCGCNQPAHFCGNHAASARIRRALIESLVKHRPFPGQPAIGPGGENRKRISEAEEKLRQLAKPSTSDTAERAHEALNEATYAATSAVCGDSYQKQDAQDTLKAAHAAIDALAAEVREGRCRTKPEISPSTYEIETVVALAETLRALVGWQISSESDELLEKLTHAIRSLGCRAKPTERPETPPTLRIGLWTFPEPGAILKCLVCARDKPYGIWDQKTGASVCTECRDKARETRPKPPGEDALWRAMSTAYSQRRCYHENDKDSDCVNKRWKDVARWLRSQPWWPATSSRSGG